MQNWSNNRAKSLSLILTATALVSCSPARNPASDQINQAVEKIKEENGENTQSSSASSGSSYQMLMEEAKKIQISGEAFASGKVPAKLEGWTFYPRTSAAVLEFLQGGKVRITMPSGKTLDANYEVMGDGQTVQISYVYEGAEKQCTYAVQTSNSCAMLNLQDIACQDKPMPLMVVAVMP